MKKILPAALLPVILLSACGDGVPKVEDPHNVVVAGQKMTQVAFLEKYCVGKVNHETCLKVHHAMVLDSTKGKLPKGW